VVFGSVLGCFGLFWGWFGVGFGLFWVWFGADQGLHYLTYIAIIGWTVTIL
jgi:hypothetical protein